MHACVYLLSNSLHKGVKANQGPGQICATRDAPPGPDSCNTPWRGQGPAQGQPKCQLQGRSRGTGANQTHTGSRPGHLFLISSVEQKHCGTKALAGPQAGNIRTVWRVRQQWVGDITRHARCPARTEPGLYFKFQPEVMQRHRNHSAASRTRTTTESNRTSVFGGAQIPADTARHLSCRQQRTSALLPFPVALAKSSASKVVTLTVSHRHPHNHP